jgi:hypothetical protein
MMILNGGGGGTGDFTIVYHYSIVGPGALIVTGF